MARMVSVGPLRDVLPGAIARGELRLVYQPEVDLRDGRMVGVEALVRWQHPEHGLLTPNHFLPAAEAEGLIGLIGAWVLDAAIDQAARWRTLRRGRPLRVWVNLAASQLDDVTPIHDVVRAALDADRIDEQSLGFEITESSVVADLDGAVAALRRLRALGVQLALDDFGTGYSSLSYLRRLPVHAVKVDRSFVSGMTDTAEVTIADAAIVEAVVDLAHALGLRAIAEGVEDWKQVEQLQRLGADVGQGYLFARPVWAEEIPALAAVPWCGIAHPDTPLAGGGDGRADELPGFGSPRARLLLTALDSASDPILVTSAARRIVYANPAFAAMTGRGADDVVGLPIDDLVDPSTPPATLAAIAGAEVAGRPITVELLQRSVAGAPHPVEVTISPIVDVRGDISHWLHVRRDLTERVAQTRAREAAETVAARRRALDAVAADLARRSLEIAGSDVLVDLDDVVERLGTVLDVDLCFVNVYDHDAGVARAMAEWVHPGWPYRGRVDDPVPLDQLTRFVAALEQSPVLERVGGDRDADWLPQTDAVYGNPTYADLVAAVRAGGRVLGCVGVGSHDPERRWSSDDRAALVKVAETLAHLVERQRIDAALRASERRLSAVFDRVSDLLVVLGLDGTVLSVNPVVTAELGYEPAETIGRSFTDFIHPDDLGDAIELVGEALAGGAIERSQVRLLTADGQVRWFEAATSMGDAATDATLVIALREITARIADEARSVHREALTSFALALSQQALDRSPLELLDELNELLGGLGSLLGISAAWVDLVDVPRARLRTIAGWTEPGRLAGAYADGATFPGAIQLLSTIDPIVVPEAEACPEPVRSELLASGLELDRAFAIMPIAIEGRLIGLLGLGAVEPVRAWDADDLWLAQTVADVIAQVLDRQRSDAALRRSEARLSSILDSTAELVLVLDAAGVITDANRRTLDLLGWEPDTLIGEHLADLVNPIDLRVLVPSLNDVLSGASTASVELRLRRADDHYRWFEITSGRILVGGIVVSARDIGARKAAEDTAVLRAAFDAFAFECSQRALRVGSEAFLAELDGQLEALARLLGADGAFVAQIESGRLTNIGAWRVDGVDPLGAAHPLGTASYGALLEQYAQLEPWTVADITLHDDAWAREWRSMTEPDRSAINVPLQVGGRLVGNLGIAMRHQAREWTDDEVGLARMVADTVANAIEQRRAAAALRVSEARLTALFDASVDLILLLDGGGVVRYANRSVERLGHAHGSIVGKAFEAMVHPDDRPAASSVARGTLGARETLRLLTADGSVRWFEVTSGDEVAVVDDERALTGRDVTDRVLAVADEARRTARLQLAFHLSQLALDLGPAELAAQLPRVLDTAAGLLGCDRCFVDEIDLQSGSLQTLACSDPSVRVKAALADIPHWHARLAQGDIVVIEDAEVIRWPWLNDTVTVGGTQRSLLAVPLLAAGELLGVIGAVRRDQPVAWSVDDQAFLRLLGDTVANAIERRRLDEQVHRSEERYRLLSESAADVVTLVDRRMRFTYVSPSMTEVLGHLPDTLIGTRVDAIVHPDDMATATGAIDIMRTDGRATFEIRLLHADGSWVWIANTVRARMDETGEIVEMRGSLRDISDRKRLEAELERRAVTDPLTGLGNRILLATRLEVAVARRTRPNPISVLLIDLDGFKQVNDSRGHAMGDEVLREVAARIASVTRPSDTLARTGGDEFVVLCPETSLEGALHVADRVIEALQPPIEAHGITVTVGASIGVAHADGATDPDALLIEADRAMYAVKRTRRGGVMAAPVLVR